jgi:hypothetical protein
LVNTFVPVASIEESCEILDTERLGKQRSEIKIILAALTGVRFKRAAGEHELYLPEKRGYMNHSATRMWRGHELALAQFGVTNCEVWASRFGHNLTTGKGADTLADMRAWGDWLMDNGSDDDMPAWWGDEAVHRSHREVLLSKNFEYYSQFGWDEEPRYEYVWPV